MISVQYASAPWIPVSDIAILCSVYWTLSGEGELFGVPLACMLTGYTQTTHTTTVARQLFAISQIWLFERRFFQHIYVYTNLEQSQPHDALAARELCSSSFQHGTLFIGDLSNGLCHVGTVCSTLRSMTDLVYLLNQPSFSTFAICLLWWDLSLPT